MDQDIEENGNSLCPIDLLYKYEGAHKYPNEPTKVGWAELYTFPNS